MTHQLHDALARIGENAPHIGPSADHAPDLWRQGRRARTRDRMAAVAAVLVVVAALGGITSALAGGPSRVLPASPSSGEAGVPSTLYTVPEHVQQQDNGGRFTGRLTSVSDVGPGAVAFVTEDGMPVLVDAVTGEYRLLDLPGWRGGDLTVRAWLKSADSQPLALSPDGTQLAWAWAEPGGPTDTATIASGVRVADLDSGNVRTIAITSPGRDVLVGQGVLVKSLAWSSDSTWLAWSGPTVREWNASGLGGFSPAPLAGRIAPGSTRPGTVWETGHSTSTTGTSIDDAGALLVTEQDGWIMSYHPRDAFGVDQVLNPAPVGAVSPDGSLLAVGSSAPGASLGVVDRRQRRGFDAPLPSRLYPDGAVVHPVGWINEATIVAAVRGQGDGDLANTHLAILSAPAVPEEERTYRVVTRSETAGSFPSVAVDLIRLDRPTVDRPAPDWPWKEEHRVMLGVGSFLVAWLTGVLWWGRRRW